MKVLNQIQIREWLLIKPYFRGETSIYCIGTETTGKKLRAEGSIDLPIKTSVRLCRIIKYYIWQSNLIADVVVKYQPSPKWENKKKVVKNCTDISG